MTSRSAMVLTALKLAAVAVVTALLFVLVVNAMRNPVSGETRGYTAEFTDASGLQVNGDVRLKGLRIGKVTGVELRETESGGAVARISFSMGEGYQLTDTSRLAIKYQNLTGVRYVDLISSAEPGREVDHLSTASTDPSYDITQLFNGLQPVLSTMRTEDINEFTQNALLLLEGDGGGLGPMLESTQRLADYAADRQQVISTLTTNLARLSEVLGGRSQYVMDFIHAVNVPISNALAVLDEFPKTASSGPAFMEPIERLLRSLGLREDLDVEALMTGAFGSLGETLDSLRLMPSALAGLKVAQPRTHSAQCSDGQAHLPEDVRILLSGSEVVLCNKK